jgi:hypothetical protein
MKRTVILIVLFIFIAAAAFADTVTVITKDNAIREYAKFFAPVKANVKYNDRLETIVAEGDWYKVRYGSLVGYIHKSAVDKRTIAQPASYQRRGSSVSESEAALAGKGFNPQVEASYKKQHPEMKFSLVDSIERYPVPEREISAFITAGGLRQP